MYIHFHNLLPKRVTVCYIVFNYLEFNIQFNLFE